MMFTQLTNFLIKAGVIFFVMVQPAKKLIARMKKDEAAAPPPEPTTQEKLLGEIAVVLTPSNHATALALAELPLDVKGYGYIKDENYKKSKAKEAVLLRRLRLSDATTLS